VQDGSRKVAGLRPTLLQDNHLVINVLRLIVAGIAGFVTFLKKDMVKKHAKIDMWLSEIGF